jgi:redox-sensitive bicupin YhaK (pirin superfamily)
MRTIKRIHKATYRPVHDLITYTPLPNQTIHQIDPFLFLNHHGPQIYEPQNKGLPFGPHPHRGMETVTFILEGDILHQDSAGHQHVIEAGGIQWMTAGSGLIHSEVSSDKFKKEGGNLEILQLWINLPKKLKMTPPAYTGFQKEQIPKVLEDNGKAIVNIIAGNYQDTPGAYESPTDIRLMTLELEAGSSIALKVPIEHSIFLYVVRGKTSINHQRIEKLHLVEFFNDDPVVQIEALEKSYLIFGHAAPFNEPVVSYGPFVMNTEEEIRQAYQDYQAGKFGEWQS